MSEIASEFVAAATALARTLQIFDELANRAITGVWLREEHGSVAEILLDCDGPVLSALAEEDFDTLGMRLLRNRPSGTDFTDASHTEPWKSCIGQPFGWGWLTMNKQGYMDGLLLGFGEDIEPKIILNVVASEIKVGTIRF